MRLSRVIVVQAAIARWLARYGGPAAHWREGATSRRVQDARHDRLGPRGHAVGRAASREVCVVALRMSPVLRADETRIAPRSLMPAPSVTQRASRSGLVEPRDKRAPMIFGTQETA